MQQIRKLWHRPKAISVSDLSQLMIPLDDPRAILTMVLFGAVKNHAHSLPASVAVTPQNIRDFLSQPGEAPNPCDRLSGAELWNRFRERLQTFKGEAQT